MLLALCKWGLIKKRTTIVLKWSRISIRKQIVLELSHSEKNLPDDQTNRKTLFPITSWIFSKVSIFGTFLSLSLHICYNRTHSLAFFLSPPPPILYPSPQNRARDAFRSARYCSLEHWQQYSCCLWSNSKITHSAQAWSGIMLLLAGISVIGDMAADFTKEEFWAKEHQLQHNTLLPRGKVLL